MLSFVVLLSPCIVRFAITDFSPPPHALHSVFWCVYVTVYVTHRHIWISKFVCVCLCQGSFLPLNTPCVAFHGCPIGNPSLSHHHHLSGVNAKKTWRAKGGEGEGGKAQ